MSGTRQSRGGIMHVVSRKTLGETRRIIYMITRIHGNTVQDNGGEDSREIIIGRDYDYAVYCFKRSSLYNNNNNKRALRQGERLKRL